MKELGSRTLDRRLSVVKELEGWKASIVDDLGGAEQVTTAQLQIIDIAVRTKLMLDSIDAWIVQQESLVNNRKRQPWPAVKERGQLADSLTKQLGMLGLERRPRPAETLRDYVDGGTAPGLDD